jgi:hypothetical protein
MQAKALTLIATKLETSLAIEGELTEAGLTALADSSDSLVIELARALVDRAGARESAEAVWARLRKREVEQMLSLTPFRQGVTHNTVGRLARRDLARDPPRSPTRSPSAAGAGGRSRMPPPLGD